MKHVRYRNSLIVGGTGMLAEGSRRVIERSLHSTLVCRRPERLVLNTLQAVHSTLLALDDTAADAFAQILSQAESNFNLMLLWAHSTAPKLVGQPLEATDARGALAHRRR